MTPQKAAGRLNKPGRNRGAQLKDEVYRQMFRLEEGRLGAGVGLATALVRAWLATDSKPESGEDLDWLRKVSPICLQMIDKAANLEAGAIPSAKDHS